MANPNWNSIVADRQDTTIIYLADGIFHETELHRVYKGSKTMLSARLCSLASEDFSSLDIPQLAECVSVR